MGPALGFWVAFVATVIGLAVSLVSGLLGRRRVHLLAGPVTMVLLFIAVWMTEQLMRGYEFPEEQMAVHLIFAKAAAVLSLLVVGTGIWLWRRPAARRWHRYAVWSFVTTTLIATATGIWVFLLSKAR